jgi:adenine-specific DNA glycosylase
LSALTAGDPAALGRLMRPAGAPLLLVRRPSRGLLGGLWELPNAPDEEAVTFAAAHGVELLAAPEVEVRHRYSHFEARFLPRLGVFGGRRLEPWVDQRWVPPAELERYPRPQAHIKALRLFGLAN